MAGSPHEIPIYLAPVHAFVNTVDVDVEDPSEALPDPAALSSWLVEVGLLADSQAVTGAQFRLAIDLRTALRALALANNGVSPSTSDLDLARRCFDRLPVVAGVDDPALSPRQRDPVLKALTRIVIGYTTARAAGEWSRLRRCPPDDCGWVFWDSSARAARRWCTMSVCGNRAKVRAYAERRASS